jgi:hypothetical protein
VGLLSRRNFAHNDSPFNPSFWAVMKFFNAPRVSSPRSLIVPGPPPVAAAAVRNAASASALLFVVVAAVSEGNVSFLLSFSGPLPFLVVDSQKHLRAILNDNRCTCAGLEPATIRHGFMVDGQKCSYL